MSWDVRWNWGRFAELASLPLIAFQSECWMRLQPMKRKESLTGSCTAAGPGPWATGVWPGRGALHARPRTGTRKSRPRTTGRGLLTRIMVEPRWSGTKALELAGVCPSVFSDHPPGHRAESLSVRLRASVKKGYRSPGRRSMEKMGHDLVL